MNAGSTRLCITVLSLVLCLYSINSHAQLKADFTSNVTSGCPPLIVAFQNTSAGNPISYLWDLGNGTKSTLKDPVTTYFEPGNYTVSLTVFDAKGQAITTKKNYITVYSKPTPDFDVNNTSGCFPLAVNMKDKSKAGSGTVSAYTWDFGDGTLSNEQSPSHTYNNAGIFDVTLSVSNSFGCINLLTKNDLIIIDGGAIASFDIASLNVCKSPASATFENTSLSSSALTYSWKFGDGQTSTDKSPTHSYTKSGNYTVQLTTTTPTGCADSETAPIDISFPQSSFTTSASTCTNQNIQFTNTSSPQPVSVLWVFGDGTTSTEINPVKAYSNPGTYKVKMVNYFSELCKDSVIQTIKVGPGVAPAFITSDTFSCAPPFIVHFSNKTADEAQGYRWDFGDATSDTLDNPVHTYTTTGLFTVKLTATSQNGCETELQKTSYIDIEKIKIKSFNNLPDSGCAPVTISPSANLSRPDGVISYKWIFGDGTTSNLAKPTHTYTKDGFYNVKLVIVTVGGCQDSLIASSAVLVGHKLHSDFIVNPNPICANQITDLINTTPDGPVHFVQWDFGSINSASMDSIHEFEPLDTGWIRIALVTYNYGCADTLIRDSALYVNPPVAKMTLLNNCNDKLFVNFGDSSIGGKSRRWDFGDGKTDTSANPVHKFNKPGEYPVTLIVKNGASINNN